MSDREQETVERIRRGDVRAFAVLVDHYKDRAMTLACRILGDQWKAEEVVQDAFLRAYKSLDQFKGDSRFGTWFYRIVHNLCISSIRQSRSRPEHVELTEELMQPGDLYGAPDASVLDRVAESDLHQHIAAELEHLPESYRIILTLFYFQELSYEEIAEILSAPLGTVKTNLFRGRALLRSKVLVRLSEEVKAA